MKTRAKIIALMLAVLMLVSLLPIASLAAETTVEPSASPEATEQAPTSDGEPSPEGTPAAPDNSTEEPMEAPTEEPAEEPTEEPTAEPSSEPADPTAGPTTDPTEEPTAEPTTEPAGDTPEETPPVSTDLITEKKDYSFKKLGLWIGNTYIPLIQPSANEDNGISPMSLLPLENVDLGTLDLSGFFPSQLKAVKLEAVLPEGTPTGQIAWSKDGDKFQILEPGGTLDLTFPYIVFVEEQLHLKIISGPDAKDQLNPDNKLYTLDVILPSLSDMLSIRVFSTDGQEIEYVNNSIGSIGYDPGGYFWSSADLFMRDDQPQTETTIQILFNEGNAMGATLSKIEYDGEPLVDGKYTYNYFTGSPGFDITLTKTADGVVYTEDIIFGVSMMNVSAGEFEYPELYQQNGADMTYVTEDLSASSGDRFNYSFTIMLQKGFPVNGEYLFIMSGATDASGKSVAPWIKKAVEGNYSSLEAASAQPDIKNQLFLDGYPGDYSTPKEFTVFGNDGLVYHYKIQALEYGPTSNNTWFDITGVLIDDGSGSKSSCYAVVSNSADNDKMGYTYKTIYLYKDSVNYEPIADGTTIYPVFSTDFASVFLGKDAQSGVKQVSGESPITFENGKSVAYSVSSEDGKRTENYYVTFVTPSSGAKLHVPGDNVQDSNYDEAEGLPMRELHLGDAESLEYMLFRDASDVYYDIYVTNVGGAPLTGLKARLENAQNVQLDPYWSFAEGGIGTLDPISKDGIAGETGAASSDNFANQAKIRLLPLYDASGEIIHGEISGYLVISSNNGGEVKIKLTGVAGLPKITTETIIPGVKYVPYDTLIQTNNVGSPDALVFSVDQLPTGIEWHENGELYGVPMESGTYHFTVVMSVKNGPVLDSKEYDLTIATNTDDNVWGASDNGYSVLNYIGIPGAGAGGPLDGTEHYILTEYTDQMFRSEGEYQYFEDFYLDGRKLTEGVDYNSSSGSTRITILEQTLRGAGEGTHTIAAEFHEVESSTGLPMGSLKRTSQNYTVDLSAKIRNDVDIVVKVQNAQGDPLSDYQVVLRSTPKYGTTNQYGTVNFLYVEYGGHTLTVTDTKGSGASASKEFTLVSGRSTSLSGNTVTAKPGSAIALTVRMDGTNLELLSAETSVPLTGDQTDFGKYATISALSGIAAVACVVGLFWQKERRRGKHARS